MTLEQLLLLAVFVLVPLLSYLRRRLERRLQRRTPPEAPPQGPAPVDSLRPPEPTDRRARRPRRPVVSAAPPAPAVRRAETRRRPRRPALGPRDLRRGIVLMAILGPPGGLRQP